MTTPDGGGHHYPPQDPTISSEPGHVYERRLILKYINDNGTDPLTWKRLTS